jgi:hypothetical protein
VRKDASVLSSQLSALSSQLLAGSREQTAVLRFRLLFLVPHPFSKKTRNGWGTGHF